MTKNKRAKQIEIPLIAKPKKLRVGKDGYLILHEDILRLHNMGRHIATVQPIIVNALVSLVNYSNDLKNILERVKRK
jgi:hypothetical protein